MRCIQVEDGLRTLDSERQPNSFQYVEIIAESRENGGTPYHNGGISIVFMISKITSCYKPRTVNLREIRILIGQFKFIAYP